MSGQLAVQPPGFGSEEPVAEAQWQGIAEASVRQAGHMPMSASLANETPKEEEREGADVDSHARTQSALCHGFASGGGRPGMRSHDASLAASVGQTIGDISTRFLGASETSVGKALQQKEIVFRSCSGMRPIAQAVGNKEDRKFKGAKLIEQGMIVAEIKADRRRRQFK